MQTNIMETGPGAAVLRGIEADQPSSRASLAKKLRLSRTTVSAAVAQLLGAGLIVEMETGAKGRGRPGIPLALREDGWFAVGAAFEGGRWRFVMTNLRGRIIRQTESCAADAGADGFLASLLAGLRAIIPLCPGKLLPLIGVGTPGTVDHGRGIILEAADMGYSMIPVTDIVRAQFGMPASVINRHWAAGMAEARFGAAEGRGDAIYIGIDTGIIAAFMQDGRLLTGSSYAAGEIGHTIVELNGPPCACGKRGCLQAVASERALLGEARSLGLLSADGDVAALLALAEGGDARAEKCLERFTTYLGMAVGNLVNMFNPRCVVLGGNPVDEGGAPLMRRIAERVEVFASTRAFAATSIRPRALGTDAAPLGAALLPLERKLELAAPSLSR